MYILFILNSLTIGGAENYSVSLMNEFVNIGHKVELMVLSNDLSLANRLSQSVEMKVMPRRRRFDVSVLLQIRGIIKRNRYDAVVSSYSWYSRLAALFLRDIPLTVYPLHSTIPMGMKSDLLRFIDFRLKRLNEIYLTSTDSQTDYLVSRYCLNRGFFSQIYNGVDTEKFTIPTAGFDRRLFMTKLRIPQDHRVILIVAGFRVEKKHTDAFEAFRILQTKVNDVTLLCVGNNNEGHRTLLQSYIHQRGIKNIVLLTAKEAGDVREYYWIADLFTLTSDKVETFSISALEAMASGVPCVLTDIGGARDYIHDGFNGFLSKANDVKDISEKWQMALYDHDFDKKMIRENIINRYSIKESTRRYIDLFNRRCP